MEAEQSREEKGEKTARISIQLSILEMQKTIFLIGGHSGIKVFGSVES